MESADELLLKKVCLDSWYEYDSLGKIKSYWNDFLNDHKIGKAEKRQK